MATPGATVLCILDGWGLSPERDANAVALAKTPNFDHILATCPNTTLTAHGPAVGLPEGQMGNSEVGHTNIGAGRVVWMDLPRINNAIADGSFYTNAALARFVDKVKAAGGRVHLAGLLSDGGVHAHMDHITAMARHLTGLGLGVDLHAYLDGRDVAPKSAHDMLARFDLPEGARFATITGRFFAMDRDNRWERVQKAFDAMVSAKGNAAPAALAAVDAAYARDESDEFVSPTVIDGYGGMADGDGLIFINFRADRAREILSALVAPGFDGFDASARPRFSAALGMVSYSDALNGQLDVMFPPDDIVNTLGAWVAQHGKTQMRIAETEKYPHVTFFLNGGVEVPDTGEERYMAPSPKVKTYDLQPEMSAAEVTLRLVESIRSRAYNLIVVNYANPDMVGHTGDLAAAIAACEAVDEGLGAAMAAISEVEGTLLVTADHGNCEVMVDPETGGPHTAHTLNPVPVALYPPRAVRLAPGGKLADLAPTLLDLMGMDKPAEMTGQSLLQT